MMSNNPKLNLVNIDAYTKSGQSLSILSQDMCGNKILTSVMGHNSIENLQKMMLNNANLDLVNINVHTKLGQILSILSRY